MSQQLEFGFTLPHGFTDADGTLHKSGIMRRATALDELMPMKDARVLGNPGYLSVILFSRVIVRLGSLPLVDTGIMEQLPPEDMAFLERFYEKINDIGDEHSHDSCACSQCGCAH